MEDAEKLLVIICEINPYKWSKASTEKFRKWMDSLMVFANSYMLFNHSNKVAFYVCNTYTASLLYPQPEVGSPENETTSHDGKFEFFTEFNDIVTAHLKKVFDNTDNSLETQDTLLAGAFSQALCYIHKKNNEQRNGKKLASRICILKTSPDVSNQYMPIMNCIFASQKLNIMIDSCSLFYKSGFLQQAADITNGIYNHVDDLAGFLEMLLWLYLPDGEFRCKLQLPSCVEIDYRAACFCHKKMVDVGFVCSICLSIYCRFMPKCLTCQTRFKLPALPTTKPKKKKK